jgi:hypothetical protein
MFEFFNLSFFICFGQKRSISEGFSFYQQVRKLPLQCHKYTIRDYILCLAQTFVLKPIKSYLKLFTIIWLNSINVQYLSELKPMVFVEWKKLVPK